MARGKGGAVVAGKIELRLDLIVEPELPVGGNSDDLHRVAVAKAQRGADRVPPGHRSVGFIDTTWIGRGGYFHSDRMRVVEKFRREGDALFYDLTLEDPEVLAEPLVFPTRILRRSAGARAGLIRERGHCETDFETEAAATQIRH